MTIGDRIKQARTDGPAGKVSRKDLAAVVGIAYSTLADIENGYQENTTALHRIARRLGVRVEWLETGRGAMEAPPNQAPGYDDGSLSQGVARFETDEGYVRFPLLEGFAGMGKGDYVSDYPEVVTSLRVSREWVERKFPGVPPEVIRVMTGRGDSMKGQFSDGDLIFLDTRVKDFDQDSAYCFRWEGRVLVKRLQFVGRNTLRILSKNPDYPAIDAPLSEIEIGGRALAAWTLQEF